jgi:hypothetical protein
MGWLDTGPPQREYTPKLIYRILRSIEHAVNYMTEQNFKNGISGTVINPGTLPGNTIAKGQLTLGQLNWKEWPIPLILLATPFTTNSEEGENIGGYFSWHPLNYPGGDWYLEASISSENTAAIATVTVRGSGEYGSASTNETDLKLVRSTKLSLPQSKGETIWLTLKTSNSNYSASLVSARLIFVPT